MNKKLPIVMLVYIKIWFFIPTTINHITRAGMLIDSRKITLIFSFISDMMDWPSQNKTLQNKRGPPLKILSNNKCIYYKNCKHAIIAITWFNKCGKFLSTLMINSNNHGRSKKIQRHWRCLSCYYLCY